MSSEKKKKIKPQRPRGFEDLSGNDLVELNRLRDSIQRTYSLYGFDALETGIIEYSDVIGSFLPDQDRPNEGVFSFEDDDSKWVSLRYDLTSGLARYVAENFDSLPKPYRRYQSGWVFRNEKPGPGRYRQFFQIDADTIGSDNALSDAEMCMMLADILEKIGIVAGDYLIKINNREIKFDIKYFGKKSEQGWSLFFSLHGGGGDPKSENDRLWIRHKTLYELENGILFTPRSPSNTWNMWHQSHVDTFFNRIIQNMIAFHDVDPNKIYLMGRSAGGDGVYQLAPRMADRFAAAAMSAGHPNEANPCLLYTSPSPRDQRGSGYAADG